MAAKKAGMYSSFNMQENTTVDLGLGGQRDLPDWAVAGSPQDCAEVINRCKEDEGLDYIGLASLNLPKRVPSQAGILAAYFRGTAATPAIDPSNHLER